MNFYKRKHYKVEIVKEKQTQKEKFDKDDIYKKSIIIEGPTGIGKSAVAERLSITTGLPVISFEALHHCPQETSIIHCKAQMLDRYIEELEQKIPFAGIYDKTWMNMHLEKYKRERAECDKQLLARKILPKLPCYEDLGYNANIASIMHKFGYMGAHLYETQYEAQIIRTLLSTIKVPIILDLTPTATIALADIKTESTEKLLKNSFIRDYVDMKYTSFYPIRKAVRPYENIVFLRSPKLDNLPTDKLFSLDQVYSQSKQYHALATTTIDADGLVENGKTNQIMLNHFCEILTQNWRDNVYKPILPVGETNKLLHE